MRIVIVEDNASMRKVLVSVFARAGHEVVGIFEDGDGLEEKIGQVAPEVVCPNPAGLRRPRGAMGR